MQQLTRWIEEAIKIALRAGAGCVQSLLWQLEATGVGSNNRLCSGAVIGFVAVLN